jgi:hypothetical protein
VLGLILGAGFATAAMIAMTPDASRQEQVGQEAVWDASKESRSERLSECDADTRCALKTMEALDAPVAARSFFEQTGWFLYRFREFGTVDLGDVFIPWAANSNDDYLVLNGHPDFVTVQREAPEIDEFEVVDGVADLALALLRAKANAADDFPGEDDLVLWAADEVFESEEAREGGQRFIFQFDLKDGCHACSMGYWARVAYDFDEFGTYLGTTPLNICWSEGERIEDKAPRCPANDASRGEQLRY